MAKNSGNFKIKTFVVCENAFFSEDKKLNIIGIFDKIFANTVPVMQPIMFLAGIIEGSNKITKKLDFKIRDDAGKEIVPGTSLSVTISDSGKANFVVKIPGLTLSKDGFYKLEVYDGSKKIGDAEFELIIVREVKHNGGGKLSN